MSRIKLLDQQLINKIAAGEVVERPASVVKELIENSLDAGATRIQVDIENGGLDLIKITDNGSGMTPEDAKMSVERHATSKISDVNDLHAIATLGFRGEALAAISSVSQFRMVTKVSDAVSASELEIREGNPILKNAAGVQGTMIEIRGLFHSVPARKKFMKSGTTEFRHILSVVLNQAMLTPLVSWKLTHNGKEMLACNEVADWKQRVIDLLGKEVTEQMIPVNHQRGSFRLSGFLFHPAKARDNLKEQYLFVNRRPVFDYLITKAVKEGYHNHIPHQAKPGFVLQISIAPDLVDVNVHPRKSEVKFADPSSIFREVLFAVKSALPESSGEAVSPRQIFSPPNQRSSALPSFKSNPSPSQLKQSFEFQNQIRQQSQSLSIKQPSAFEMPNQESGMLEQKGWKLLGQAHDSYLIVQSFDGLILVDQHAVAEKVLYEELIQHVSAPKIQQLLVPVLIEVNAEQKALLTEFDKELQSMGIEGQMFGGSSYQLSGIPQNVKTKEIKKFLLDLLDDMSQEEFQKAPSLQKRQEELAKSASCRGAIKFGDPLSWEEQLQLLKSLLEMNITACCHGRPVMFEMSNDKINREFGRP